jgi:Ni,Fe-hydrogenase III large subunit
MDPSSGRRPDSIRSNLLTTSNSTNYQTRSVQNGVKMKGIAMEFRAVGARFRASGAARSHDSRHAGARPYPADGPSSLHSGEFIA